MYEGGWSSVERQLGVGHIVSRIEKWALLMRWIRVQYWRNRLMEIRFWVDKEFFLMAAVTTMVRKVGIETLEEVGVISVPGKTCVKQHEANEGNNGTGNNIVLATFDANIFNTWVEDLV